LRLHNTVDIGYNRDEKKGKIQIVIGLITDNNGFTLKIEISKGNIKDDTTVQSQLKQININDNI
jgi:transposase